MNVPSHFGAHGTRATNVAALVVGAGPAGLASAACLKKRGIEVVVLEAGLELATSWRNHYLRLHVHTTKQQSSLPGLPFPDEVPLYPSRAQVASASTCSKDTAGR